MNQLSKDNAIESFEKLYGSIKEVLNESRQQAYQAVNSSMLIAYWTIGKIIVENEQDGQFRAEYGKYTLSDLSLKLSNEFGKGFTVRSLQQMKKFYTLFPNTNALRTQLTWTHYRSLLRVENKEAREWYIEESVKEHWSSRQLDRQISTMYYERLISSQDKSEVVAEANDKLKELIPEQFIKDPYVLEFIDLKDYPALRESVLEQALIDNLQSFLLELGRGFCFVARQKLLRYEDEDFYIDLVFYHSILKCYVLIDLKIGKLTHGDVGQMDSYIRMFDDLYKNDDDNPTIGLLLCSEKNEAIAKYSVLHDEKQMFASKYLLTLPTAEELEKQIENERHRIEEEAKTKR
ncbi:PDDEXK nuclease domain-containing protein [Massilicoli timonensis]|uniref:PDDEXK nuclease domain-containing protein n=1 Tax=Massilicoli timonensis TaxID=2015901 RepID=A0ABT1SHQ3_9FIRM|nr:PDDEXK nuclease domain-containing protein [Massilicoli timonensis]MCQ5120744.1 PDDEXK nuclease domain-containing protein [Massilicoli timonensis]